MRYRYRFDDPELEQIFESVGKFGEKEIKPFILSHVRGDSFPSEMFRRLGDEGYLGAMSPTEYGGMGYDMRQFAVLMEGVAAFSGSVALGLAAHHSLASSHIMLAGTDEHKKTYLPALASGSSIGSWCLTEAESGSDAFGSMVTRADRTGNGWHLTGTKMFVTNGTVAGVYVVLARVPELSANNRHAYRAFIVPKGDGVTATTMHGKLGMRASDTAEVTFDVQLPDSALMQEHSGFETVLKVLDRGRVGIAAMACGLMRSSLDRAVSFAKQRVSSGKKIHEYQAISHSLAMIKTHLNVSWLELMAAADAVCNDRLTREQAAQTKVFVTENCVQACLSAVAVMGGTGYFDDQGVSLNLADAVLLVIGEGTSSVMKNIIARGIMR